MTVEEAQAQFDMINEEVNRRRDLYSHSKILYMNEEGFCFIHDEIDRLDMVDYEISKSEARELQKNYIVYVNDGTPQVSLRKKLWHDFYTETGLKKLRKRADPLWDTYSTTCIDFQTIFAAAKSLKGKVSFAMAEEYVYRLLEVLNDNLKPVDVMALIVFSLSSEFYNYGSWEKEEVEHLESMFREMVEGGEPITEEDVETAASILFRVAESLWQ